jgi:Ca-activated chloride channel family protein
MNELLSNFHFLRPWWLLGLLVLPLLWRNFGQAGADGGGWRGAVDAHLLPHLLVRGSDAAPSRWPRRLAVGAWLLCCVALAGPAWEQLPQPLYQNHAARVFALELSASMLAQDVKPSRYERARFKLDDMLAHSGDLQTALIAYAGDAFVVAPLTDDANTVLNLIDALDPSVMPVAGNATGRAIDAGVQLIKQAGAPRGQIVLLADSVGDDALPAAQRARAAGVRINVLGIGSAAGAPVPLPQGGFLKSANGEIVLPRLDASMLTALAQAGGGQYLEYTPDAADLNELLALDAAPLEPNSASPAQATTTRYLDRGPWLVLLLLPLVAAGFRRGWLMLLPLCFLHAGSAQAFSWADLWQRPDQQARSALDAGQAQQAQQLARAPELRGSAAYRVGDFAAAEKDFSQREGADANYNRGNALAKQGRYAEAIAAYDAALKRTPDMADAAANKRAVEEWLKQQQQRKQASQQSAKDHQGRQQQQDGSGSSSEQPEQQDNGKQQGSQDQGNQEQSDKDSKSGENHQQQQGKGAQDNAQQGNGADQDKSDDAGKQSANAKQSEQQAQEQFRQKMDQAVKKKGEDGDTKTQPVRLGANSEGKAKDERQQAVEQLIERVPDDPGGLLRRKFQLEYQRRQNRDGGPQ